jgi:hypothetical protein
VFFTSLLKLKTKLPRKEKMTKIQLATVELLSVLMTLALISYVEGSFINPIYASQQEGGIGTLAIKAYLDKIVVEQGKTQTINFQVADQRSHIPIGGAITSATVNYADGKTVKQFSMPTDASGRSSISWKIERNAPTGRYDVGYSVSETGYVSGSFGGSFSVIARNVNNDCLSSSDSSLIALPGPSTHISSSSSSSQTCRNVSVDPSTHISSSSSSSSTGSSSQTCRNVSVDPSTHISSSSSSSQTCRNVSVDPSTHISSSS